MMDIEELMLTAERLASEAESLLVAGEDTQVGYARVQALAHTSQAHVHLAVFKLMAERLS